MSAIAGIRTGDPRPVDASLLARMRDAMAHRGEDEEGIWTDGSVGLAHRMRWTTPESLQERQPLRSADGMLVIVADARVDNRGELRDQLDSRGVRPRSDADAELILSAYEAWGEDCPARIMGDFAFAIWDGRRRRLLLARDPMGIRPLYYQSDATGFRFASEPGPILQDEDVPRRVNRALLCRYLAGQLDEPEETLFEGILLLPAACSLVVEDGRVRKQRYWDFDPGRTIRLASPGEYAEQYLDLFRQAVQSRLRSHGGVGLLLSGGLDSGAIACMGQKILRERPALAERFETFSFVFDELPCDERRYIGEIVQKWGIRNTPISYEQFDLSLESNRSDVFPVVLWGAIGFLCAPVFDEAGRTGVRILLDGNGGDEFFAMGLGHMTDQLRGLRLHRFLRQLRNDAASFGIPARELLFRYYAWSAVRHAMPRRWKRPILALARPFRRRPFPWIPESALRESRAYEPSGRPRREQRFPTVAQQEIYDWWSRGGTNNLLPWEHVCGLHGLETRQPFYDRRLAEFMMALPGDQRWDVDRAKPVLRRAMEGILPEGVRNRSDKTDFLSVLRRELAEKHASRVEDLIRTSRLESLGILDSDRLLEAFEASRKGVVRNSTWFGLARFVRLELWFRRWAHSQDDRMEATHA